jgi:hypothetical protein
MNDYLFDKLKKMIGNPISGKVVYLVEGETVTDYIQGVLKSCDVQEQTITIEQHIPFVNLLLKNQTVKTDRTIKISEFENLNNLKA